MTIMKTGAEDFLSIPVQYAELVDLVRRLLSDSFGMTLDLVNKHILLRQTLDRAGEDDKILMCEEILSNFVYTLHDMKLVVVVANKPNIDVNAFAITIEFH